MPETGPGALAEVERSGLRGKGGARFPTATKLAAVASRRRAVVVANGTEGEHGAADWLAGSTTGGELGERDCRMGR